MILGIKKRKTFYLFYSLFFVLLSALLAYFYYSQGNSIIDFSGDGFRQHYRALLYYSELLKGMTGDLFSGRLFPLPQWDFSLGEGEDIVQTLHYYGIGDPVFLLSVFFQKEKMHLCYDLAIFIRMYLAGVFFSLLCFYKEKKDYNAVLVGSLLYGMCGYSLVHLRGHTFFLNGVTYLPLIILGIERSIDDRKPYVLSLAVLLSSISNVYFFYMNVVMTVIYVVVRLLVKNNGFKDIVSSVIRITLYSALGLLLSAVVFFPMFYAMINNGRVQDQVSSISLFYPLSEYRLMFSSLIYCNGNSFGSFSALFPFAIAALLDRKDIESRVIEVLCIVATVLMTFPVFGLFFNAMTYVTSRWVYGISLLMAYLIVDNYDGIKKPKLSCILFTAVYYFVCYVIDHNFWQIHAMFLLISIAYFIYTRLNSLSFLQNVACISIVVFGLFFHVMFQYSPFWSNDATRGTALDTIIRNTYPELDDLLMIKDNDFWRYSGDSFEDNASVNSGFQSSQFYWSIANDDVIEFRRSVGLLDHNNHHYDNYDDRFILNALSSTKYYIEENSNDSHPFGFELYSRNNDHSVFVSNYSLPLVYAYDKAISKDAWDQMDILGKQEVLHQMAVIDDNNQNISPIIENIRLETTIESDDVQFSKEEFSSLSSDAAIVLQADYMGPGEYYLLVEGLDGKTAVNFQITTLEQKTKVLYYKPSDHPGNADKHDFAVNLGYIEDGQRITTVIEIPIPAVFEYRYIGLAYQPLEHTKKEIEALKNSIKFNDAAFEKNAISAKVSVDKEKTLCFAIPFSDGWKAYVDGVETNIEHVNVMYMGFPVSEGEHQILLEYRTPLLQTGSIITLVSFAALACLIMKKRNSQKKIFSK